MFLSSAVAFHLPQDGAGRGEPTSQAQIVEGCEAVVEALPLHAHELLLEPTVPGAAPPTAAQLRATPLHAFYSKLTDMANGNFGVAGRDAAARILLETTRLGGCTATTLAAFNGLWRDALASLTHRRCPPHVLAAACGALAQVITAHGALGRENPFARELSGHLSTLVKATYEIAALPLPKPDTKDHPSGSSSLGASAIAHAKTAALEALTSSLTHSPGLLDKLVRGDKLVNLCVSLFDSPFSGLAASARRCRGAIAVQEPQHKLSANYATAVLNSLFLLLDVSIPQSARLGLALDGRLRHDDEVLTLPPLLPGPEAVLRRFTALFDALRTVTMSLPVLATETAPNVPGGSTSYLGGASTSSAKTSKRQPIAVPLEQFFKLCANIAALSPIDNPVLRRDPVRGAFPEREGQLPPVGYNTILPSLWETSLSFLSDFLAVPGSLVLPFRRSISSCILRALDKASLVQGGVYTFKRPRLAAKAFALLESCMSNCGAGFASILVPPCLPYIVAWTNAALGVQQTADAVSGFSYGDSTYPALGMDAIDAACTALAALQTTVCTTSGLLDPSIRGEIDRQSLFWARHVAHGHGRASACLRSDVYACFQAALSSPLPSGASSYLVVFAGEIFSAGTRDTSPTVRRTCLLGMSVAESILHPRSTPLALPIHAVDLAAAPMPPPPALPPITLPSADNTSPSLSGMPNVSFSASAVPAVSSPLPAPVAAPASDAPASARGPVPAPQLAPAASAPVAFGSSTGTTPSGHAAMTEPSAATPVETDPGASSLSDDSEERSPSASAVDPEGDAGGHEVPTESAAEPSSTSAADLGGGGTLPSHLSGKVAAKDGGDSDDNDGDDDDDDDFEFPEIVDAGPEQA